MLMRRHINVVSTRLDGRRVADYHINRQEVILDPWETDDCAVPLAAACAVEKIDPKSWNTVAGGQLLLPAGQQPIRILEDLSTGYIYYRRPIDIERQQKWNADREFQVTANEW